MERMTRKEDKNQMVDQTVESSNLVKNGQKDVGCCVSIIRIMLKSWRRPLSVVTEGAKK